MSYGPRDLPVVLIVEVRRILKGIEETEVDALESGHEGWWETSTGAKWGSAKLRELERMLKDLCHGGTITGFAPDLDPEGVEKRRVAWRGEEEVLSLDADSILHAPCIFCGHAGPMYWQTGEHFYGCPWRDVGGVKERQEKLRGVLEGMVRDALLVRQHRFEKGPQVW